MKLLLTILSLSLIGSLFVLWGSGGIKKPFFNEDDEYNNL